MKKQYITPGTQLIAFLSDSRICEASPAGGGTEGVIIAGDIVSGGSTGADAGDGL